MSPPDALGALAAVFILGMAWLRTRLQYRGAPEQKRSLTGAGVAYFVALALLMVVGWFVAARLAQREVPAVLAASVLARALWFLGVYYLSIPLRR
jgi:hypothetical protein